MRMKILRKRWTSRTLAAALAALAACPNLFAAEPQVILARPGARLSRPLPEAVDGGIRLSLNETIALALANNADLNVSVNTAEASRYNLMLSKGIFDPLFQGSAIRSHTESPATSTLVGAIVNKVDNFDARGQIVQLLPIGGTLTLGYAGSRTSSNSSFAFVNPSFGSTMTLSLSQPLLRNFGLTPTYWQIKIARNTEGSAYLDFVRSVQTVVNVVELAYWDLVYAIENLKVKRESLAIAQDLNRITRIKIEVGSLAPIDIVQTEVGIAQAEQDIILAEGLIGDAQDRLKRGMNYDQARWSSTPIVPIDKVQADEMVSIRIDDATRVALEKRPEVQQALFQAQSDNIRYQYWRNESLPGLNLIGSYGNPGIGGTVHLTDSNGNPIGTIPGDFGDAWKQMTDRTYKNWSFGLQFSYPILNRAGRGALGAAKYNFESSKARLTTTEQNVQVDVRAAARAIDTAARSILAARKGRELAERNIDAERKKFENGMSTTFQVNQIQRDLSAARTTEMQALAVYRKAVSAFHYAVADILEWKGVQVESMPEEKPSILELRRELRN
jgi:outer membrane protein TolC